MDQACNKFRGYLHKTGVNESFVVALTELYRKEERPFNPTEFIRQNMPPAQADSIAGLTKELEELEKEIESLRKMIPEDRLPKKRESFTRKSNAFESGSQFSIEPKTESGAVPNDVEVKQDSAQKTIEADVVSQKSGNVKSDMPIPEEEETIQKEETNSVKLGEKPEVKLDEKPEAKLDENPEGTETVAENMNNDENKSVKSHEENQ